MSPLRQWLKATGYDSTPSECWLKRLFEYSIGFPHPQPLSRGRGVKQMWSMGIRGSTIEYSIASAASSLHLHTTPMTEIHSKIGEHSEPSRLQPAFDNRRSLRL